MKDIAAIDVFRIVKRYDLSAIDIINKLIYVSVNKFS
jgi:hypothetical protein